MKMLSEYFDYGKKTLLGVIIFAILTVFAGLMFKIVIWLFGLLVTHKEVQDYILGMMALALIAFAVYELVKLWHGVGESIYAIYKNAKKGDSK